MWDIRALQFDCSGGVRRKLRGSTHGMDLRDLLLMPLTPKDSKFGRFGLTSVEHRIYSVFVYHKVTPVWNISFISRWAMYIMKEVNLYPNKENLFHVGGVQRANVLQESSFCV